MSSDNVLSKEKYIEEGDALSPLKKTHTTPTPTSKHRTPSKKTPTPTSKRSYDMRTIRTYNTRKRTQATQATQAGID